MSPGIIPLTLVREISQLFLTPRLTQSALSGHSQWPLVAAPIQVDVVVSSISILGLHSLSVFARMHP